MVKNNLNIFSKLGDKYKLHVEYVQASTNSQYLHWFDETNQRYYITAQEPEEVSSGVLSKVELVEPSKHLHKDGILRVHFPEHKPDIHVKYLVEAYMNISDGEVVLCGETIGVLDLQAAPEQPRENGTTYYECYDFKVPDVSSIAHSEEFAGVREAFKSEENYLYSSGDASIIDVKVTPIEDGEVSTAYTAGCTALQANSQHSDYLLPKLDTNVLEPLYMESPSFRIQWQHNGAHSDVSGHIRDTYGIEGYSNIKYYLEVRTEDDIYDVIEQDFDTSSGVADEVLITPENEYGWDMMIPGLYVAGAAVFLNSDDEIMFQVPTEKYALVPEVMKYFIGEEQPIHYVNLDYQDMNVYNFNLVNKIQKNIIQVERPDNYKANIIKPVFYKVQEAGNIVLNPEVSENICINLDGLKSKTSLFYIQIEGVIFNEIGRTAAGVVFNIDGKHLPNQSGEGRYYILDSSKAMMTDGKYTYSR